MFTFHISCLFILIKNNYISLIIGHHEVISLEGHDEYQGGDRTPDQVDMLRERSKSYLGLHVIVGGAILGKIFR